MNQAISSVLSKAALSIFALVFLTFHAGSALAQKQPPVQKQPPAMSADYFPERWKEFSYPQDGFKIRFPKEPTITTVAGQKGETTTIYKHASFVPLEIRVTTFPVNLEERISAKTILEEMKKIGFEGTKELAPKIIKETDIAANGKTGKFIHTEASTGEVLRMKFFVSGARVYYMFAGSKKGDKHGVNWENDFEKVAMGFLDSFKVL
ncbi:MAG TPA: hypothetical protein VIL74_13150 [Pyrinomonadaceae bacterium]|jgi:hypothetical protein